ncbi:uncharacterized protein LOC116433078 [Nomia melanderi]|uniref:uncharacterized protein LOC116433078 n=1 Tax=Nomia melanderi TaxID=2448451 RepID=UPI0013047C02|nr:uncharacterized protein LOC116433078 [Nomia melanderi]
MHRLLCFALLLIVFPFAMQQTAGRGACKCGVFPMEMSKLIIERSLELNVTCDSEGEEKCLRLCAALAESVREKAPHLICKKLNVQVENMWVEVYARICDATAWKFTGLRSAEPLCCHDGKSIPCRELAASIVD